MFSLIDCIKRSVSFLSLAEAVRFRQLFQTFLEAVHAALLIVKLLWLLELIKLQPNREP